MTITFYNAPAAAPIPVAAWPGPIPPLPAPVWPGAAAAGNNLGVNTGDIAFRVALDIYPSFFSPLMTAPLTQLLNGALLSVNIAGGAKQTIIRSRFKKFPSNWKRIFSETISVGTALSIADINYNYPYFVPLEFCKNEPYPDRPSWPIAYAALVPTQWRVDRLWLNIMMPDYILAHPLGNGGWVFSTLEAKGRDKPVHTANYANFCNFKRQSMNARLIPIPNAPVPPLVLLGFTANFLSISAIRGSLKDIGKRVLQARWFNNRPAEMLRIVPDRWGIALAASHYGALLYRLGLKRLGNALSSCLLPDERLNRENENLKQQLLVNPDPVFFGLMEIAGGTHIRRFSPHCPGTPVLSPGTFDMLVSLARALNENEENLDRETTIALYNHNAQTREKRDDTEFTAHVIAATVRRGSLALSASGVGIAYFHMVEEDDIDED